VAKKFERICSHLVFTPHHLQGPRVAFVDGAQSIFVLCSLFGAECFLAALHRFHCCFGLKLEFAFKQALLLFTDPVCASCDFHCLLSQLLHSVAQPRQRGCALVIKLK
jgi:hypothetical protein